MKYLIPLTFLLSILLFSCASPIDEKELIGDWKVVDFKANYQNISPALMEIAREEALSTRYSFQKDNTFSMSSSFNYEGKASHYKFNWKTNKINMIYSIDDKNSFDEYEVELLNSNAMHWAQEVEGIGSHTMIFKKE